ncbi:30S ribosomal protein S16 [Treponema parvum]|uniref:Small ribosomal subunit protein bS16 n=1 Tax=Treponema parvum TaxID=138851 RepID=A0A975F4Q0_9SPIR|nr:30S ribosomal protein S16 [Treponema parvum]QTQ14361.1 30S ribosomal protein S16 [Treponema parvum]
MVKIRLKKFGAQKQPYYRIVVQDVRKPRDGVCIEELGTYRPIAKEGDQVSFNVERVKYWLSVGAQPTETVGKLIKKAAK